MARPESVAKAGYYPTPPSVVERVSALIRQASHSPRQAVRLLDPCCGTLHTLGPATLLVAPKTALFCSARSPGAAILRAHDAARHLRDEGVTVISGFHSPLEKECLRILLRGTQPILICLARAMPKTPVLGECRSAFEDGRILFLSPFETTPRRVTRASAIRRNDIVAALADEVFIANVTPGGETERLRARLQTWGVSLIATPDDSARVV